MKKEPFDLKRYYTTCGIVFLINRFMNDLAYLPKGSYGLITESLAFKELVERGPDALHYIGIHMDEYLTKHKQDLDHRDHYNKLFDAFVSLIVKIIYKHSLSEAPHDYDETGLRHLEDWITYCKTTTKEKVLA